MGWRCPSVPRDIIAESGGSLSNFRVKTLCQVSDLTTQYKYRYQHQYRIRVKDSVVKVNLPFCDPIRFPRGSSSNRGGKQHRNLSVSQTCDVTVLPHEFIFSYGECNELIARFQCNEGASHKHLSNEIMQNHRNNLTITCHDIMRNSILFSAGIKGLPEVMLFYCTSKSPTANNWRSCRTCEIARMAYFRACNKILR